MRDQLIARSFLKKSAQPILFKTRQPGRWILEGGWCWRRPTRVAFSHEASPLLLSQVFATKRLPHWQGAVFSQKVRGRWCRDAEVAFCQLVIATRRAHQSAPHVRSTHAVSGH